MEGRGGRTPIQWVTLSKLLRNTCPWEPPGSSAKPVGCYIGGRAGTCMDPGCGHKGWGVRLHFKGIWCRTEIKVRGKGWPAASLGLAVCSATGGVPGVPESVSKSRLGCPGRYGGVHGGCFQCTSLKDCMILTQTPVKVFPGEIRVQKEDPPSLGVTQSTGAHILWSTPT